MRPIGQMPGKVAPFMIQSGGRGGIGGTGGGAALAAPVMGEAAWPSPLSPTPTSSFLALDDDNTSIPPDTHGAVGPNHLMVTLNTQVRIQDRNGVALSTVSLDGFWASLGAPSTFDPKVLYDPFANRWMFTAMADGSLPSSAVLIGVSQTSDPTGNWNLYRIDADVTNRLWADYPSLGFNKDWIVVTVNMFPISSGSVRSQIYVFDKADLYARGAGRFTLLQDASGFTQVPAITYDNTLSAIYLIEDWSGVSGQLRLSTITGALGSERLTSGVGFPTATNTWADFAPDNFAPQFGASRGIMNNDARLQNVIYRSNTLWTAHTVFLPAGGSPTHSAVQWWEINPTNSAIIQLGRMEDTNAFQFYAFPSLAVNKNKDMLIGYSRFSASQYASANYAFRAGTDPLNTLRADTVLKAGEAPYVKTFGGSRNRWGDYSSTLVDPVNDTDMWTIQEYAATPRSGFDRWGTWWGRVVPPLVVTPFVTITDVAVAEGNSGTTNAVFQVTMSRTATAPVTLSFATANGTAAAGSDYFNTGGTLTFPPGSTNQTITVFVNGDTVLEPNETFFVSLSNVSTNAILSRSQAVGTILNDEGPLLLISDATVDEGDSGTTNATFTVTLLQAGAQTVTASFATADGTTAAGSDYLSTNGFLVFPAGMTNQTITVQVLGDTLMESNETFFVNLSGESGATLYKGQGVGTIIDDESRVTIDDVTINELDVATNAVFKVSLNKINTNIVTVSYATLNITAVAGADYTAASGTLIFPPGTTNQTITVSVAGDLLNELTETFAVVLSSSSNAPLARTQGICTILDNDPFPGLSVTNSITVVEGNSGTTTNAVFAVRLTSASGQLITVDFVTGVGRTNTALASAGADYLAASGTLVFAPGVTSNAVPVTLIGDALHEADETFSVRIFNPVRATNVVGQDIGYCTIQNDDSAPILSVNNPSFNEGNSGTNNATFTVSLSIASGLTISANFATADQTAVSSGPNADYLSTNGTVVFPPGVTTQTISVPIISDVATELNEAFLLNLTGITNAFPSALVAFGTILNDDGPILSINDVSIIEGNSGTNTLTFTVSLSPVTNQVVTVDFATANGTATAGLDYVTTNGTLTFPANTSTQTISVQVLGETLIESSEIFYLNLGNPSNATINKSQGIGSIIDDDTMADLELLITRSSPTEWNGTNYAGHEVTYAITVTNRGPYAATNVVVTNSFLTGVTLVSATNSQGTFTSIGTLFTFDLGVVGSNASATATLTIVPTNTSGLTNSASVYCSQPDTNLANNVTNVVSAVAAPFVSLTNNASAALTAESVTPANGAIDPGETVTLTVSLTNAGNVRTTNLVVTLLATNGVTPLSGARIYGAVAPHATVTSSFDFRAAASGTVSPILSLMDGSSNLGVVTFTYASGTNSTFASTNPAALTIPIQGPVTPDYPSRITVSNLTGVINRVTVTLSNVTHTFPSDLDILLVGPNGASVVLMSDVSVGDNSISSLTLTLDDSAADYLPEFGQLVAGAYKPTNYGTGDVFTNGPAGPFGATLSVFSGLDQSAANGVWSLYVVDDANGDSGSLGGWSLAISTVVPVNNTAELSLTMSASPNPVLMGSNLVYTLIVTNHGPKTAQAVTLSDVLPANALLAGVSTTLGTVATNGGTLVFSLGSLASGGTATSTITVINPGAGTATNSASVSATETDLNLSNNSATALTQVNRVLQLLSQTGSTLTNGQFGLQVMGQSGLTYVIEVSTNLVNWTPVLTNPPTTNGIIQFIDTNVPGSGRKFYRALER